MNFQFGSPFTAKQVHENLLKRFCHDWLVRCAFNFLKLHCSVCVLGYVGSGGWQIALTAVCVLGYVGPGGWQIALTAVCVLGYVGPGGWQIALTAVCVCWVM